MNLEYRYLLIDLFTTVWLNLVFFSIFFWFPSWICCSSNPDFFVTRLISCFVRITLALLVGVIGLSLMHLFNGLTLFLWYLGCLGIGRACRNKSFLQVISKNFVLIKNKKNLLPQETKHTLSTLWQRLSFIVVDFLDGGVSLRELMVNLSHTLKIRLIATLTLLPINTTKQLISAIAFLVILGLSIILRWEYPLKQLRFSNPNNYSDLLVTQEIITNHFSFSKDIPIFSTLGAILASIGSIDAMQTIRFFSPLIGLLLLLSLIYCLFIFTKEITVALVGFFSFGCYIFTFNQDFLENISKDSQVIFNLINNFNLVWIRQWTASEVELGTLFLLLALVCLGNILDRHNFQDNLINLIACLLLITLTAPLLLFLLIIGSLGVFLIRQGLLIIVTIAWILLSAIAMYLNTKENILIPNHYLNLDSFVLTSPIAISLFCSFLFLAITNFIELLTKKSVKFSCLVIFIIFSCNFFLPLTPQLNYLEYEMAARKSLEIRTLLPRKQWVIVAPIEQLAQSYSLGWYEDLAQFVEQYQQKVEQPEFNFPFAVDDIFVFVEKRPFNFKNVEYQLSYSVLNDLTYTNYRSPTGRAALEFQAWQLCEKYRLNHEKSSIYHEDNNLIIYHFYSK